MLKELATQIHENNKAKGFYDEPKNIGEMLCLMHSEISEALEADRQSNYCNRTSLALKNMMGQDDTLFKVMYENLVKGTFEEEMADIFIRTLDMCAFKGIDLDMHVKAKMKYNSIRPHKHGKKY